MDLGSYFSNSGQYLHLKSYSQILLPDKHSSQSVTTAQAMTSLPSHHTYTLQLVKCSIARDIDYMAKKGL